MVDKIIKNFTLKLLHNLLSNLIYNKIKSFYANFINKNCDKSFTWCESWKTKKEETSKLIKNWVRISWRINIDEAIDW